ncbi:hypothetical protein IAD21_06042 [Abditibacteriota bacterium]|nr:hypothetical protein IAD21_06042 [Abditibacteriota bacterium]
MGLTVASYSGYTLEELQTSPDPWVAELLTHLDMLIDGRYVAAQRGQLPWRGSDNQRVHFLGETYTSLEPMVTQPGRTIEFIVGKEHFVSTGIFDPEFVQTLEKTLAGDL